MNWTPDAVLEAASRFERDCTEREYLGALEEERTYDVDPHAALDGTEDAAFVAAENLSAMTLDELDDDAVDRAVWIYLQATRRAIEEAAERANH